MRKMLVISSVLSAIVLMSCSDKKDEVVVEVPRQENSVINPVPDVETSENQLLSKDEILENLLSREPSDSVNMLADARLLYDGFGDEVSRDISNSLWAGNNGFSRNRRASGAIAVTAFENAPKDWSTVRSGIAFVNGMGVDQDATRAINILSDSSLSESSAAQFFLAKAYEINGQQEQARVHYTKAADMGHRLAKIELSK